MLEKAEIILQCVEDIQEHFSEKEIDSLVLRVMASGHLMENLLSSVIMYYHQHVPKVHLVAEAGEYETIIAAVKNQAFDVGVINTYVVNHKPVCKIDAQLQYDEIFSMPLYVAVAAEASLAKIKAERVSYADLASYPAIVKVSSFEKDDFVLKKLCSLKIIKYCMRRIRNRRGLC